MAESSKPTPPISHMQNRPRESPPRAEYDLEYPDIYSADEDEVALDKEESGRAKPMTPFQNQYLAARRLVKANTSQLFLPMSATARVPVLFYSPGRNFMPPIHSTVVTMITNLKEMIIALQKLLNTNPQRDLTPRKHYLVHGIHVKFYAEPNLMSLLPKIEGKLQGGIPFSSDDVESGTCWVAWNEVNDSGNIGQDMEQYWIALCRKILADNLHGNIGHALTAVKVTTVEKLLISNFPERGDLVAGGHLFLKFRHIGHGGKPGSIDKSASPVGSFGAGIQSVNSVAGRLPGGLPGSAPAPTPRGHRRLTSTMEHGRVKLRGPVWREEAARQYQEEKNSNKYALIAGPDPSPNHKLSRSDGYRAIEVGTAVPAEEVEAQNRQEVLRVIQEQNATLRKAGISPWTPTAPRAMRKSERKSMGTGVSAYRGGKRRPEDAQLNSSGPSGTAALQGGHTAAILARDRESGSRSRYQNIANYGPVYSGSSNGSNSAPGVPRVPQTTIPQSKESPEFAFGPPVRFSAGLDVPSSASAFSPVVGHTADDQIIKSKLTLEITESTTPLPISSSQSNANDSMENPNHNTNTRNLQVPPRTMASSGMFTPPTAPQAAAKTFDERMAEAVAHLKNIGLEEKALEISEELMKTVQGKLKADYIMTNKGNDAPNAGSPWRREGGYDKSAPFDPKRNWGIHQNAGEENLKGKVLENRKAVHKLVDLSHIPYDGPACQPWETKKGTGYEDTEKVDETQKNLVPVGMVPYREFDAEELREAIALQEEERRANLVLPPHLLRYKEEQDRIKGFEDDDDSIFAPRVDQPPTPPRADSATTKYPGQSASVNKGKYKAVDDNLSKPQIRNLLYSASGHPKNQASASAGNQSSSHTSSYPTFLAVPTAQGTNVYDKLSANVGPNGGMQYNSSGLSTSFSSERAAADKIFASLTSFADAASRPIKTVTPGAGFYDAVYLKEIENRNAPKETDKKVFGDQAMLYDRTLSSDRQIQMGSYAESGMSGQEHIGMMGPNMPAPSSFGPLNTQGYEYSQPGHSQQGFGHMGRYNAPSAYGGGTSVYSRTNPSYGQLTMGGNAMMMGGSGTGGHDQHQQSSFYAASQHGDFAWTSMDAGNNQPYSDQNTPYGNLTIGSRHFSNHSSNQPGYSSRSMAGHQTPHMMTPTAASRRQLQQAGQNWQPVDWQGSSSRYANTLGGGGRGQGPNQDFQTQDDRGHYPSILGSGASYGMQHQQQQLVQRETDYNQLLISAGGGPVSQAGSAGPNYTQFLSFGSGAQSNHPAPGSFSQDAGTGLGAGGRTRRPVPIVHPDSRKPQGPAFGTDFASNIKGAFDAL
ncbi:hypothetical protein MBM_08667 [Drepanopeziza brunnea f. sp. 'multigermtubi' MB_m1]|uniref:Uncharacterized protein n=1 Tax=Marssonina brunnea f. sp. multigermtubi (strain MB_m1) TaxID=1072389 RepID=K1XLA0_MARBU|nr:uncharacterized protein MBM_08667 [Drepanopeziza brunnea f. sp. 'multigermtubi' MB_m1]EKD13224.1 hypothetical protein MBM_08667 [Drepanopeziza brunnea f. sp. 'multigermtubi' MB_m1]